MKLARRPAEKPEFLGLAKYDRMLEAIAECHRVDEVKEIHDLSAGLEKYARQAKNYDAELRAMDVRIRASQRAGELIAAGQRTGAIASKGKPRKDNIVTRDIISPQKLKDIGITPDQSSQWQQLAGIDPKEVEKQLPRTTGQRTSIKKIIQQARPKPDPARVQEQKLKTLALRVWGGLRDLPGVMEDEKMKDVVGAMDQQLIDGVEKSIPKVRAFLSELEKELKKKCDERVSRSLTVSLTSGSGT